MHLLYLFILFAIPSVLLAQKCPRQFLNPRTEIALPETKVQGSVCWPRDKLRFQEISDVKKWFDLK